MAFGQVFSKHFKSNLNVEFCMSLNYNSTMKKLNIVGQKSVLDPFYRDFVPQNVQNMKPTGNLTLLKTTRGRLSNK